MNEEKPPVVTGTVEPKRLQCPHCTYTTIRPSVLSRHINQQHKKESAATPEGLLKRLDQCKSIPEMLSSVSEWLNTGATVYDSYLPAQVVDWIKRQDAKAQLSLRLIVMSKVLRALDLDRTLRRFDDIFAKKIKEPDFERSVTPGTLLAYLQIIQEIQKSELSFVKEISSLGNINPAEIIDKLVAVFQVVHIENKSLNVQGTPKDPSDREALRQLASALLAQEPSNGK